MTSFINVPPPNRGPSIGEQIGRGFGSGFGGAMQQAASGYLQGKIQQMFRNQELERARPAATALLKSFNLPTEATDMIIENPAMLTHLLQATPPTSDSLFGNNAPVSNLSAPAPIQASPEQIQAAQIQQNRQNLQPTISTRNINPEEAALPFVKQEFQRQRQEEPYRAQYAAQAAEAAKPEEERKKSSFPEVPEKKDTGIEIPEIKPKPDFEQAKKAFFAARTNQERARVKNDYLKQEEDYLESIKAHNDAVDKLRKNRREEEREPLKEARKAGQKAIEAGRVADEFIDTLDSMAEIRKRGNLGPLPGASSKLATPVSLAYNRFLAPEGLELMPEQEREDRAAYDANSQKAFSFFKSTFPRGFTQSEFNKYEKTYVPNSKRPDAANRGAENALREMAILAKDWADTMASLADEKGNLPANAETLAYKKMHPKIKEFKKRINDIGKPVYQVNDVLEKLPPASQMTGKTLENDKGRKVKSDGKTWVEVQ